MKKKTTTSQPLSANTKMALIITAIVVLAAIILTIVLVEILKPIEKTPAVDNPSNNGSSSLTIKNGDFAYADSAATSYPQAAQNWTRYGAPTGENSTSLVAIEDSSKALMGIIDTDDEKWDEVKADLGMENLANPKTHDETLDSKVYMIAAKEATSASILSDQFSVPSNTSVKITVWLKTSGLKEGSKAVVMLSQSTTDSKQSNWYAYDFEITAENGEADNNGWICKEFYLFNRYSSSRSIRCSVGLGNVYGKGANDKLTDEQANAEGVLFIDDISFETVTANEYRVYADGDQTNTAYKIIENTDSEEKEFEYKTLVADGKAADDGALTANALTSYKEYMEDYIGYEPDSEGKYDLNAYKVAAPFTQKDDFDAAEGFTIYSVSNNGKNHNRVGLRLENNLNVKVSDTEKDHHHFSFWVRIDQNNSLCDINIVLQKWDAAANEYKDVETLIKEDTTSQDIADDTNNGWKKYDLYVKPSSIETELSILITLGAVDGYLETDRFVPDGTMYVTSPSYELISQKDYTNASSGTTTKKVSLVGVSASMDITNGSFNDFASAVKSQPASWTAVFAGKNAIYKDGKGDEAFVKDLDTTAAATKGTGVTNKDGAPSHSDPESNILKLVNNAATSQGYLSSNITLSAHSVYAISVLAKAEDGAKPYIYLINNSFDRANAVVAKITDVATKDIEDKVFGQLNQSGEGWHRYYIIVVTGDESQTVRLGLFNGSIDGKEQPASGATVYFDNADMVRIGTYSMEKPEDENATLMDLTYADEGGKYTAFDKLELKDFDNITTVQPTEDEWKEIRAIPEEKEDDNKNDDNTTETPEEPTPVDLGLLFSVLSSVLLLAALLIVVVVKVYRNKSKKAA